MMALRQDVPEALVGMHDEAASGAVPGHL